MVREANPFLRTLIERLARCRMRRWRLIERVTIERNARPARLAAAHGRRRRPAPSP